MADDDAKLIRELKDDLRDERLRAFWHGHGQTLVAVLTVLILALAGWTGWRQYSEYRQRQASERFAEALRTLDGNQQGTLTDTLKALEDAPGNYPALAALNEAKHLLQTGKTDEAIARYRAVVHRTGVAPEWRELAALNALRVLLQEKPEDRALRQPFVAFLEDIATPVFPASVDEMRVLLAHAGGGLQTERATLDSLTTRTEVPPSLRQRAEVLHGMLPPAPHETNAAEDGENAPTPEDGG